MLPNGYRRIERDVENTTAHRLFLRVGDEMNEVVVEIDGVILGSFSEIWSAADAELHLVELVDRLQGHSLDRYFSGGWPTCPIHHTHPLTPAVRDEQATWVCPALDEAIAKIGELSALG